MVASEIHNNLNKLKLFYEDFSLKIVVTNPQNTIHFYILLQPNYESYENVKYIYTLKKLSKIVLSFIVFFSTFFFFMF